ncbi:MAG: hypothetical protein ACOYN6_00295 [Ignavibacteria bacterium]
MINKLTSEEFISRISKLHSLRLNEMYSEDEFNKGKAELLMLVIHNGISQDLDDFLTDILELKTKGILTIEEIQHLKTELSLNTENITHPNNFSPKQKHKSSENIIRIVIGAFVLLVIILLYIIIIPENTYNNRSSYSESESGKNDTRKIVEKKYKLKLGTMYLYSTNTVSAYWEFTNNSSDFIDQITMEAFYSCCANSAFGIKFKNVGPGKTVKTEDLMKGSGKINMLDIKEVELSIIRFMVNGKHDLDAKDKIEFLPNKYDRKISFK